MSTIHEVVDGILDDLLAKPVIHYARVVFTDRHGAKTRHHFASLDGVQFKEVNRMPKLSDYGDIAAVMKRPTLWAHKQYLANHGARFSMVKE